MTDSSSEFDKNCELLYGQYVQTGGGSVYYIDGEVIPKAKNIEVMSLVTGDHVMVPKKHLRPLCYQKGDAVTIENYKTRAIFRGRISHIGLTSGFITLTLREFDYEAFSFEHNEITLYEI